MTGSEINQQPGGEAGNEHWLAVLGGKDGLARERARNELVKQGPEAVPGLLKLLRQGSEQARLEAVKALKSIADPSAGKDLCERLEDTAHGVRWVAAEALIALGPAALPDLLLALEHRPESLHLREGAHHVLKAQMRGEEPLPSLLAPVLEALEGVAPAESVPVAAQAALREIKG